MELLFWGKTDNEGRWHPAVAHMIDTGLVAKTLITVSFSVATENRIGDWLALPQADIRKWLPFVIAAHDLGKVSPGFQSKAPHLRAAVEKAGYGFSGKSESDHSLVTRVTLAEQLARADCWPALRKSDARALAAAVGAHHGSFHRPDRVENYRRRELGEEVEWQHARLSVLRRLATIFGIESNSSRPHIAEECRSAALEWLAGFTALCDWVGSDADFGFWGDREVDLAQYVAARTDTARRAVSNRGLAGVGFQSDTPRPFSLMFPTTPEPRQVQSRVMELAGQSGAELVVLEASTGSGKTEAALALAEQWGASNGMRGLYVALPTMATSNSLFARVKDWAEGLHGGRIELHLLHGHALLNPEYESLLTETRFVSISDGDRPIGGEVLASAWFTGRKRGLLAPFAVGTIDQALLAILDARHQFLRLYGLADRVLILDEIHAYDTYTTTLIERLLSWARAMGCRVILLSATLPASKVKAFVHSWSGDKVDWPRDPAPLPRITLISSDGAVQERLPVEGSRRPAVKIRLIQGDLGNIAQEMFGALDGQGCAACICNTVRRAQELYIALTALLGQEHVTLIHARMPLGERLRRESRIIDSFGRKSANRPKLHVVIGTQVLEQSLDVDFDIMFSELAPVDLILQRIGRLHRHSDRHRPDNLTEPTLLLETPSRENGEPVFRRSDIHVYSEAVLLRSWFSLRNVDSIGPDDVDTLIAHVYDHEPVGLTDGERELVAVADEKESRVIKHETAEALERMIDEPTSESFPDSLQRKSAILEEDSLKLHISLQALTRLGPPSISLVCVHKTLTGLFLEPKEGTRVDTSSPPSPNSRSLIVQSSVSVSNYSVYKYFSNEEAPGVWKKDPVLRHTRLVQFVNGQFYGPGFVMNLDPELGLLIDID